MLLRMRLRWDRSRGVSRLSRGKGSSILCFKLLYHAASGSSASALCKVEGVISSLLSRTTLNDPWDPALESEKVGYIIIYASPSHLYLVSIYYAGRMKYALSLYLSSYLHKPPSCFIFRSSYCLLHLNFLLLFLGVVTSCDTIASIASIAPSKFLPLLQVLAIHKHPSPPGLIAFTSCMVPLSGTDIGYYSVFC